MSASRLSSILARFGTVLALASALALTAAGCGGVYSNRSLNYGNGSFTLQPIRLPLVYFILNSNSVNNFSDAFSYFNALTNDPVASSAVSGANTPFYFKRTTGTDYAEIILLFAVEPTLNLSQYARIRVQGHAAGGAIVAGSSLSGSSYTSPPYTGSSGLFRIALWDTTGPGAFAPASGLIVANGTDSDFTLLSPVTHPASSFVLPHPGGGPVAKGDYVYVSLRSGSQAGTNHSVVALQQIGVWADPYPPQSP